MESIHPTSLGIKQDRALGYRSRSLFYHIHTIWLFSWSDLKTVVFPQTAFGCVALFARGAFGIPESDARFDWLPRLPLVVLWIWINLLGEVVANQRLEGSIIEDSINKPWRPLPSKRVTPDEARSLLLWILLPLSYLAGVLLGGSDASVALMVFSYMYNDLGGANENWLLRNMLNACGLSSFSLGAAKVAWGPLSTMDKTLYAWVAILAAVISSTVQLQDLPDIEGDKARGRRTMPLLYGKAIVRWSICIPTLAWSIYCPYYWNLRPLAYLPSLTLGFIIGFRVLIARHGESDAVTWKLWCAWMMILYSLPLFRTLGS
jgi:4-hydroxybenzoate polyprenyltransferase